MDISRSVCNDCLLYDERTFFKIRGARSASRNYCVIKQRPLRLTVYKILLRKMDSNHYFRVQNPTSCR